MNNEKTFKASTGWTVQESGECHKTVDVRDKHGKYVKWIGPTFLETLREYFQNERDTELGRTRWPENPDYVIYRDTKYDGYGYGRRVHVLHEPSGISWIVWEQLPVKRHCVSVVAAKWYFEEGPGKIERPWENAKAGEVWRLTVDGKEGNYLAEVPPSGTPYFHGGTSSCFAGNERITAGRKRLEADGGLPYV